MTERHWTLDAIHLGRLSDAESTVVMDAIYAVLKRYRILPARTDEYSILGAFEAEYAKARIHAAAGSGDTRPPNFDLRAMADD